jgi:hypothetical protein
MNNRWDKTKRSTRLIYAASAAVAALPGNSPRIDAPCLQNAIRKPARTLGSYTGLWRLAGALVLLPPLHPRPPRSFAPLQSFSYCATKSRFAGFGSRAPLCRGGGRGGPTLPCSAASAHARCSSATPASPSMSAKARQVHPQLAQEWPDMVQLVDHVGILRAVMLRERDHEPRGALGHLLKQALSRAALALAYASRRVVDGQRLGGETLEVNWVFLSLWLHDGNNAVAGWAACQRLIACITPGCSAATAADFGAGPAGGDGLLVAPAVQVL